MTRGPWSGMDAAPDVLAAAREIDRLAYEIMCACGVYQPPLRQEIAAALKAIHAAVSKASGGAPIQSG